MSGRLPSRSGELLAEDAVVGKAGFDRGLRMARSAARSAAVTGSNAGPPALFVTVRRLAEIGENCCRGNVSQVMSKVEIPAATGSALERVTATFPAILGLEHIASRYYTEIRPWNAGPELSIIG